MSTDSTWHVAPTEVVAPDAHAHRSARRRWAAGLDCRPDQVSDALDSLWRRLDELGSLTWKLSADVEQVPDDEVAGNVSGAAARLGDALVAVEHVLSRIEAEDG